jgi:hypothetical protein
MAKKKKIDTSDSLQKPNTGSGKKKAVKKITSSSPSKTESELNSQKSVSKKVSAKPTKKSAAKKTAKKATKKSAKKPAPKKRGRKVNSINNYNIIKSAIAEHYQATIGRSLKRYEMKVLYQWIKEAYVNQNVRYIVMNIDVIVDNFWTEYCNLFPVDLYNHARFFDWFNLKTYLNDEKEYHYPSDIIEIDLTEIGQGFMEFFMEDYLSKADEYYQICVQSGVKRESPPPSLYLKDAACDTTRRGNVYKYVLLLDSNVPSETTDVTSIPKNTPSVSIPSAPVNPPISAPTTTQTLSADQIELELGKERLKKEYELKQEKLKELSELLKLKVITFQEYMDAIKAL